MGELIGKRCVTCGVKFETVILFKSSVIDADIQFVSLKRKSKNHTENLLLIQNFLYVYIIGEVTA